MNWTSTDHQVHRREAAPPARRESYRGLPAAAIVHEAPAVNVRQCLGLGFLEPIAQEQVLSLIPDLRVHRLSEQPMAQVFVDHARCDGYGELFGLAHTMPDGSHHIIFNDAHDLRDTRVTLLEEFFHLYLGHPTETVRRYPVVGAHRTYNDKKEKEAYGCATATLVPYHGLRDMMARAMHLTRMAEHFNVPPSVILERIGSTGLDKLATEAIRQYSLRFKRFHRAYSTQ